MENIKITLKISSFSDSDIPKPSSVALEESETITYNFRDKDELIEYINKLHLEYIKFDNPKTDLIADLLGQIARQIK